MRTIVYGTLVLATAGAMALDWAQFQQISVEEGALIRMGVLIAAGILGIVILLDGVISSASTAGSNKADQMKLADLEQEAKELKTQNQDLIAQVSSANFFESELKEAKGRVEELERALRESKDQISKAKAASQKENAGQKDVVAFLSVLQKKGRLIDFLMDDISAYPDPQVGAAARIVHQGCAGVLKEYFAIAPIHQEKEGAAVRFEGDIDVSKYRILGKADGSPPFSGRLVHHGWRTDRVNIPKSVVPDTALNVIAPAEVELG